jgi:biotin transporter BioY
MWGFLGTAGGLLAGFVVGAVLNSVILDWQEKRRQRWLEAQSRPRRQPKT